MANSRLAKYKKGAVFNRKFSARKSATILILGR